MGNALFWLAGVLLIVMGLYALARQQRIPHSGYARSHINPTPRRFCWPIATRSGPDLGWALGLLPVFGVCLKLGVNRPLDC